MLTTPTIDINKLVQSIYQLMDIADKELHSSPKGFIRLESSKGYPRFYYYKNRSDTKGKYMSADNIGFITAICQRDYLMKVSKRMHELICKVKKGIHVDLYVELDNIYYSFNPGRRSLITPIIPDIETFVKDWYNDNPSCQNTYLIDKGVYTKNGELVRSKSEKIIADRLLDFEIPYVYEPKIVLSDNLKYPDFITLNKRTRTTIIWEHFGLSDDQNYSVNNMLKLSLYEQSDYHLGKNLIASFETSDDPLDSFIVDKKIEAFLL
ncbi:hypothetical protein [Pseudobutyrivibrio ruminis]|uniref:hypothetical protein n=1 Tax=Pseudobutyrivibrio ruminis TaxID=46206 RepID=UPI000415DCF5|nr:hypothetical protein [Pseudobutyrivibrio ruminis]